MQRNLEKAKQKEIGLKKAELQFLEERKKVYQKLADPKEISKLQLENQKLKSVVHQMKSEFKNSKGISKDKRMFHLTTEDEINDIKVRIRDTHMSSQSQKKRYRIITKRINKMQKLFQEYGLTVPEDFPEPSLDNEPFET